MDEKQNSTVKRREVIKIHPENTIEVFIEQYNAKLNGWNLKRKQYLDRKRPIPKNKHSNKQVYYVGSGDPPIPKDRGIIIKIADNNIVARIVSKHNKIKYGRNHRKDKE